MVHTDSVPVYKVDDMSNMNYLESDTVWINTSSKHGLGTNYHQKHSHLFINDLCAPEYTEVARVKGNYLNNVKTVQGPYASTNLMEQHFSKMNLVSILHHLCPLLLIIPSFRCQPR